jgi:hypothetical protein
MALGKFSGMSKPYAVSHGVFRYAVDGATVDSNSSSACIAFGLSFTVFI